jgi:transcriptional regulator with XRE-family HTH domain
VAAYFLGVLAERVRIRRGALGLSQEAVARRAGLNRSYLAQLETGRRNPSLRNLILLAHALECDVGDLVKGLSLGGDAGPE